MMKRSKLLVVLCGALLISEPVRGQSFSCRFQSEEDLLGRDVASGTVVKTATAAIIEYDSGAPTIALTCPLNALQCKSQQGSTRTNVDFSYVGQMIIVTQIDGLDLMAVGLARLYCQ